MSVIFTVEGKEVDFLVEQVTETFFRIYEQEKDSFHPKYLFLYLMEFEGGRRHCENYLKKFGKGKDLEGEIWGDPRPDKYWE